MIAGKKFLFIETDEDGDTNKFYRKPEMVDETCKHCGKSSPINKEQYEINSGYQFGNWINDSDLSYYFFLGLGKFFEDIITCSFDDVKVTQKIL